MASYVESSLSVGECVVFRAKVSWLSVLPSLVTGSIFLLLAGVGVLGGGAGNVVIWLLFLLGVWFITRAVLRVLTTELAITNKRVIAKFGLIRRNTVEIKLQRIESIQVDQGVLGRIFNFGSVVVAGAGNPQAPIPGIDAPLVFRKQFAEVQEVAEHMDAKRLAKQD